MRNMIVRNLWRDVSQLCDTMLYPTNVVEEEASDPSHERTVDGCHGSAHERPGLSPVVWDGRVRVMQVCQHDDPVVRQLTSSQSTERPVMKAKTNQVRNEIVGDHRCDTVFTGI
jgi:hypothetical protein